MYLARFLQISGSGFESIEINLSLLFNSEKCLHVLDSILKKDKIR